MKIVSILVFVLFVVLFLQGCSSTNTEQESSPFVKIVLVAAKDTVVGKWAYENSEVTVYLESLSLVSGGGTQSWYKGKLTKVSTEMKLLGFKLGDEKWTIIKDTNYAIYDTYKEIKTDGQVHNEEYFGKITFLNNNKMVLENSFEEQEWRRIK